MAKGKAGVSLQPVLFFHDPSAPISLPLHNDQTIKSGAQIYLGSWLSHYLEELLSAVYFINSMLQIHHAHKCTWAHKTEGQQSMQNHLLMQKKGYI